MTRSVREDLTRVLGVPARARVKRGALLFLWHGLGQDGWEEDRSLEPGRGWGGVDEPVTGAGGETVGGAHRPLRGVGRVTWARDSAGAAS